MTISPPSACTTMFRATSEIAVATSVASVREKPRRAASARPSARAATMSSSDAIATCASSAILIDSSSRIPQHREAFLEVERGVQRVETQLELDHRDGDVGLDPDENRLGAAQPRGKRDRPQRSRDERVDDVERGDVDHD